MEPIETNRRTIIARLERDGWTLASQEGPHDKYKHPHRAGRIIVPRHRELSIGVARAIARPPIGDKEGIVTRYIALVDGEAGGYGVVFPDLPGCTTMGNTIEEAMRNAADAVRIWATDAIAEGEALPAARGPDAIRRDPEVAEALAEGATLVLVPLLFDSDRSTAGAMG